MCEKTIGFMPVVTRKVKGGEYLYFREWDAETKEHHDEYLGKKGETETERKARLKEREAIIKEMTSLQTKLSQINASIGELDSKIVCRPFVKWAGGKTQLIEKMKKYFPEKFDRYYEPFLGGAAVFFHLVANHDPFPATLSDSNHDLINAYETIRNNVEGLIKELSERSLIFKSKTTKAARNELFLDVRANPPDIDAQPTERAGWFIFLNKTAYNGLYRVNSQNGFNVPYGGYTNVAFFETDNLRNINSVLNRKGIEIVWADYSEVLSKAKEGDFDTRPPVFLGGQQGIHGLQCGPLHQGRPRETCRHVQGPDREKGQGLAEQFQVGLHRERVQEAARRRFNLHLRLPDRSPSDQLQGFQSHGS